jgi:hypothetical protein
MHEKRYQQLKLCWRSCGTLWDTENNNPVCWRYSRHSDFVGGKCQTTCVFLLEKIDGRIISITFLQAITRFRRNGSAIVYSDETYIHSSDTTNTAWSADTPHGHLSPKSKGQRLIFVHAGIKTCFIPDALFIFKSNQKKATIINKYLVITTWGGLRKKLLLNLPQNCVFVVDNSACHDVLTERCPISASRKKHMKDWVLQHKIPFTSDLSKTEF